MKTLKPIGQIVTTCVWCLCVFGQVPSLSAQDGAALYTFLCASCHDAPAAAVPNRDSFRALSPERVLESLEAGNMVSMASGRSTSERRAIAQFVTGKSFAQPLNLTPPREAMCSSRSDFNADAGPAWNGWGVNTSNTRYQDAPAAGFSSADVPRLKLKWAFGFPGDVSADAQPTIVGGRVFVGSGSGNVYALSTATGCVHWFFQAAAPVRAAVTIGRVQTASGQRYVAFIGDRAGNVYALDAATGMLLWKTKVDNFPLARVTGSPAFYNGRLYVGVASGEENAGAASDYQCCRFRGSLVSLNAANGEQVWRTYTITEEARPTWKNKNGVQQWGPSGAPIWTSPAIDPWPNATGFAGYHPDVAYFLKERGVSFIGSDGPNDVSPSPLPQAVGLGLHQLALVAMGVSIFDNLDFERVAEEARRLNRYEFLFVASPLRIEKGMGSPLNPLAIF